MPQSLFFANILLTVNLNKLIRNNINIYIELQHLFFFFVETYL